MLFSTLAENLARMEETTKRLELTSIMVDIFKEVSQDQIAHIVYLLQGKVRPDYEGVEVGVAEKIIMHAIAKSSGTSQATIQARYVETGDLGQAASLILEKKSQTTLFAQEVTVDRVYNTILKMAQVGGSRSQDMKIKYISSLLNDASPTEARFILKILLGSMRLGVAENTIMDALAEAYTGDRKNRPLLEEAYNVSSDLGRVAKTTAKDGLGGLESFSITPFSPIRPMLAERIRTEKDALDKMGTGFAAEYKLDGERVQIHVADGRVEVFSRKLERITEYYPDVIEAMPEISKSNNIILEAEAVPVNADTGEFLPFQNIMRRRRKHGLAKAVADYPVLVNFFDVLYVDGQSFLDETYDKRRQMLQYVIKEGGMAHLVPMMRIEAEVDIVEFMESSVNAGCEGLMIKSKDSIYRAGSRGSQWLKLKQDYQKGIGDSLDLVVIGAFHGKGRRAGTYGTLLLATYDSAEDMFLSICKVGSGFKDEDLDTLYQTLGDKILAKKDLRVNSIMEADVWFAPELVIEVVAAEITRSPIHTTGKADNDSGFALRFPRFTGRIRADKSAEEASTVEEILALYGGQAKTT
ncbi:MAG: ATP-dependent DNA ligase [Cenarchaeum sp. SB0661_bin_35]|nr:ATP-dependent DNA ligase [Cenarchaeum sp. SB0667_bin_13]MXY37331.1 ATP-dependent DNA ligase [Cenarchaeum sp. SB0664_bin_35]MXZ94283.1 ATP-dependent DNA ligase [Cenarchaeum sp. SB0666_bin_15]MYB47645.1 ATP-dependent DNA ligase [Cenarchaeum sp. SB0662_bin_33]MYC80271.1 ATP-dependent DNA ligase [Cenarchaeum sp. SB0661_bin_35]MYD58451.1 ATP-dependent DNA ligase [Cenarchaeum sp. SB0678_bin_8]MYI52333.1 ATP-dependent DNA ligase [Cenarchaeum sp. SB0673_bin_9]MYJ27284.1 ATP-dependent DNA ligase [